MRKYSIGVLSFLLSISIFGQDSSKKNEVFIEIGNNSYTATVNYRRQLYAPTGLALRAGIGSYYFKNFTPVVPVVLEYRFKMHKPGSYFDAGFGFTWTNADPTLYTIVDRKFRWSNPHYFTPILSANLFRQMKKDLLLELASPIFFLMPAPFLMLASV